MKKSLEKLKFCIFSFFICLFFTGCMFVTEVVEEHLLDNDSGPTIVNQFPDKNRTNVLMLFYMDGDNNLAQAIWQDLNEIEYGLYRAEQNSSVPAAKVDIFVLWDGDKYGDTRLYKIGADERLVESGNPKTVYTGLSKNTLDLTSTATWIYDERGHDYEVSMSNPKTLENFLRWANEHYLIDNNTQVILQFANHGGGPRSLSVSDNGSYSSRAICQDDHLVGSNNQMLLLSKDVPNAIKNSGILSRKHKIDLVIQDVCNGASVEEAYEYKDVADYMLLSPNEMPGYGLNYVDLVGRLCEGDCISDGRLDLEKFLDKAVYDFISAYRKSDAFWSSLESELREANKKLPINQQISSDAFTPLFVSLSFKNVATISAIKLENIQQLQIDLKNLTGKLNESGNIFKNSSIGLPEGKSYLYYLFNLVFRGTCYYKTTYGRLFDIGDLTNNILAFNEINESKRNEITDAANKVLKSLESIILYSWRDGVGGALYNKSSRKDLKGIAPFDSGSYGLVISGIGYEINQNGDPVSLRFPDVDRNNNFNYSSELLFGKDTEVWERLMKNIIASNRIYNLETY